LSDYHEQTDRVFLNYLDGRNTPEELQQLKEWAGLDMEHIMELRHSHDIYLASSVLNDRFDPDTHQAWLDLKKKCKTTGIRNNRLYPIFYQTLKIAALLAVIFLSGIMVSHYSDRKNKTNLLSFSEYHIPRGSRSHIFLPDGTSVWLNAQSTLKYHQDFGNSKREVLLEGEAFFDVVRDESKTFIVKAGDAMVRVSGSALNVKAYPEEGFIETTVERGKVQVTSPGINAKGQDIITLAANQKIKISKNIAAEQDKNSESIQPDSAGKMVDNLILLTQKVDFSDNISAGVYSSWKDTEWIIEHEYLKELAIQMERRYNVKIEFRDKELENYVFSGKLKDESLEQVLHAISIAAPVKYSIDQKQIIFCKK
jgi:ferric-dicitrate binding protein FerR (iron transport regulator)